MSNRPSPADLARRSAQEPPRPDRFPALADVDQLRSMVDAGLAHVDALAADRGAVAGLARQAAAFEQLHQVLVTALSTVDKA